MQPNPEIEQIVEKSVELARTKKHKYVLTFSQSIDQVWC